MKHILLGLMASTMMTASALAADIKPAVIYDLGGKNDKSFNEAAFTGAEKFKTETGIAYDEFEISNDAQREQALIRFARKGNNPIVAVSFQWSQALAKIAPQFPDTQFAIIDGVVELPNVRSVVYKEHEGSYLVGILAAMAAESSTVGFVGGMDIPLIRRFACGYAGGAKSVNADMTVLQTMTGTTGAAWTDPVKGGEITKSQISEGADVIFQAAGGTGLGVLQAAADAGKLGIGVDSNQNYIHPGSVLTSMIKRVDLAVYNAFMDSKNDAFTSGFNVLGLAEEGVGYSLDEFNESIVTDEMKAAVEAAKADIISGKVVVHDYMSDDTCPY